MIIAGIDIGSRTVKLVVVENGEVVLTRRKRIRTILWKSAEELSMEYATIP
jgi:activator of 2-hydroxyglutaryl-CoA dehydratase